jgi:hypothetical protein
MRRSTATEHQAREIKWFTIHPRSSAKQCFKVHTLVPKQRIAILIT